MRSIMKALGFSEQDLRNTEATNAYPPLLEPETGIRACTPVYSKNSMIAPSGLCSKRSTSSAGIMVEKLQAQKLVIQLTPSNGPKMSPQLQASEETSQPGHVEGCPSPTRFGWRTALPSIAAEGASEAEKAAGLPPERLPTGKSSPGNIMQEITSQCAGSNICMPKEYISSALQRSSLQGVVPNEIMLCKRIQTHYSSIYGGLVHNPVSPTEARATAVDYQHQHQDENRQRHVRISSMEEVSVHSPAGALPASTEDMGTFKFPDGKLTETQKEADCMRSSSCALGGRYSRSFPLTDSQASTKVPEGEQRMVWSEDDTQDMRRKQIDPMVAMGKRKHTSPSIMAPLNMKRSKEAKDISLLSTRLSLCVTPAKTNPGVVFDASHFTSMGSGEWDLSEHANNLRASWQQSPGTRNGVSSSGASRLLLESSWLGLTPSPPSAAFMPRS